MLDCGAGVLSNERLLLNYSIEQLCDDLRIHVEGLLGHFFCEILFLGLTKIIKDFGWLNIVKFYQISHTEQFLTLCLDCTIFVD